MQTFLDKTKIGGIDFVRPSSSLQGTLNTSIGEEKVSGIPTPQMGTVTPQGGVTINSEQNPQGGSLVDFQTVMRSISKNAYDSRKGKEKGIMKGQFDASKVSGSVFKAIMDSVEGNRGNDISKVYSSAVEAAKFDIEQKQAQVKQDNDMKLAQQKIDEEKRQYNATYYNETGNFPSEVGSISGFSSPLQANGMPWRTDLNNNPIAAAVKIGGRNQFTDALDKAGIAWGYGSEFPNDPSMATIKILGNPVEAARTILATTNSIQGWYLNASSGSALRQTGVVNNQQFAALSKEAQDKIIIEIYKGEVGNGMLVKDLVAESTNNTKELQPKTFAEKKIYEELKAKEAEIANAKDISISDFTNKKGFLETAINDTAGLAAATGTNWLGRTPTPFSGDRQRFISEVEQIVSTDSLNALIKAKAAGATFGALSNAELEVLRSSATKIGSWAIKDGEKTVGYNIDQDTLLKELKSLKVNTEIALEKLNKATDGEVREINGVKYKKVPGGWESI